MSVTSVAAHRPSRQPSLPGGRSVLVGKLSAGGIDVASAAAPDACDDPFPVQVLLERHGIFGGIEIAPQQALFAFTECHDEANILQLVEALTEVLA